MVRSLRVSAFALVCLLAVAGAELSQAVAEGFLVAEEQQMHALVNGTRGGSGIGTLPNNDGLRTMARRQAQNMAAAGYIYHTPDLVAQAKSLSLPFKSLGENVGVGPTVEAVENAFLNSPGHRANIVDPEYNALGVGATAGANGALYFSQNFGNLKAPPPPAPPQPVQQATAPPPPPVVTAAPVQNVRPPVVQSARRTPQPATAAPTVAPTQAPTAAPPATQEPAPVVERPDVASGEATALAATRPGEVRAATQGSRENVAKTLGAMLSRFFERIAFWR